MCPEDLACARHAEHARAQELYPCCRLPVCTRCEHHLRHLELPNNALANDMWTGAAPAIIHEEK
eukprot:12820480-Prorocentrum_lima.AAC.1